MLGHENMGVVEEVGAGVDRIKTGDRVSVPFNIACGTCRNCDAGWTSFCLRANPSEGVMAPATGTRTWARTTAARPSTCACRTPTSTCSSCRPATSSRTTSRCSPTSSPPAGTAPSSPGAARGTGGGVRRRTGRAHGRAQRRAPRRARRSSWSTRSRTGSHWPSDRHDADRLRRGRPRRADHGRDRRQRRGLRGGGRRLSGP